LQKETTLALQVSRDRVLGRAFLIAICLGGWACAKVGADPSGTGGAGGVDAGTGGGGASGTDGGAGSTPIFDAPIFGERPPTAQCGNSVIEFGENCDDGNNTSGDGCSSGCVMEADFTCPMLGKDCVHDVVCGDHMIEGMEACDDGNKTSGDGCAADCTLECGWECPPGALCRALKCGDGKVAGKEQCDDGNTTDGDGCSALCTLESKPVAVPEGWVCTTPAGSGSTLGCMGPTTCTTTVCGNKMKEGSEQCDDGNTVTGDGCSPFCRLEPVCPAAGGACTTACGDGLLLPIDKAAGQECDDGNTVDGDGCSSKCKVEDGFKCNDIPVNPTTLVLPVVYHDFKGWREAGGHPDFEHYAGQGVAGIALPLLGANGVPVHVPMCVAWSTNLCAPGGANPTWDPTVDWFGMWYTDNATFNKTIVSTLTLPQIAGGAFQFNSNAFFPIDGIGGWGNTPGEAHNFGFTSATRYWFEYSGAATLTFLGDDDVFVYVNKQLAVDLGGTHQAATGSISLDATSGHGYACDYVAPGIGGGVCDPVGKTGGHDIDLGLKIGSVYETVVFQAERHTSESNYQLTLSGFKGIKSSCVGMCGDGAVVPPEICDLGAAMNTGAYGGCKADCTLAPYCGDKMVQGASGEECDGTIDCDAACKKIVVK
jgi:fibro-slime domain-containing protein